MSTAPTSTQSLFTAEEFARRPDSGHPEELVRGRIEVSPTPGALHGYVCSNLSGILRALVRERDLGRVFSSDAGVVTERDPDSVRGPDVSFYSYEKLPKGPLTRSYPAVPPDAVFEVLSPNDRWPKVHGKVAEHLNLGIRLVAVLDPEREEISVYTESDPVRVLSASDELVIPVGQGDLRVPVQGFFE